MYADFFYKKLTFSFEHSSQFQWNLIYFKLGTQPTQCFIRWRNMWPRLTR